jgi:8-oxo-dGTP pyrophosphatase MutT (NUDIX family)
MMDKQQTLQWISDIRTEFDEENFFRKKTLEFLIAHDEFWQRSTLSGHLTGSAWVLNPTKDKALLIHHMGLEKWFQPGGHAESTDSSLLETARREAAEECGLQELTLLSDRLFDLDIHIIPAKKDIPEHVHYDLRFAFLSESEVLDGDVAEVKDLNWVSLEGLLRGLDTQQALRRMAIKTLLLSSF